ncbi:MAG: Peptidase M50 [Parcubacteria group bacterium GW2011_GWF2_39_13b]|nr:MAG: Peptidase M50 [Parcubacteria group bacterium GW2011_GWF2_39_13b]
MPALTSALFLYIVIIFSSIIHEYSHGWAALQLGDPTAKYEGRLTLNPLAHIDPFGTVLLPIFLLLTSGIFIGYAKPVPFNPMNLRDPRRDAGLVGVAGPASNLVIVLILGLIVRFMGNLAFMALLSPFLKLIIMINIWLALFNLIPVPPLDGSKVLLSIAPKYFGRIFSALEGLGIFSIIIALFVAMTFLSYLAFPLFDLIVGQPFIVF